MNCKLTDFETGWFGVSITLKTEDIDRLIEQLQLLKSDSNHHFHFYSTAFDTQDFGIADIEFVREDDNEATCNIAIE